MNQIPDCYYRISIKALVLNETRDKFLLVKEPDGRWELPGGGLDWGVSPEEDLQREISEEMGLTVTWMAANPSYFVTDQTVHSGTWYANVIYEAELEHLDFTPSDECVEVRFFSMAETEEVEVFPNVAKFVKQFDPRLHAQ